MVILKKQFHDGTESLRQQSEVQFCQLIVSISIVEEVDVCQYGPQVPPVLQDDLAVRRR